jgi:hypothetical protein
LLGAPKDDGARLARIERRRLVDPLEGAVGGQRMREPVATIGMRALEPRRDRRMNPRPNPRAAREQGHRDGYKQRGNQSGLRGRSRPFP